MLKRIASLAVGALLTLAVGPANAAELTTTALGDGLFMLSGKGGNIGLSVGEDGAFLIDDQYAPATPDILAAVKAKTDKPVRIVFNTHWHGDHTGGNENFGTAGAVIVAHENTRTIMTKEQYLAAFDWRVPPSPRAALPVVTFTDTLTLHLNGHTLKAFHIANAHTGGDALVHFAEANVVHMGDIFFNGFYPFIDTSTGGSIAGMIKAVDAVLALTDNKTKIVPGHGPLATKEDLQNYRDMLLRAGEAIGKLKSQGKDKAGVIAAKPTRDLDAEWGDGFLKPDKWVGLVYDAL